jgi:hypothetical protein
MEGQRMVSATRICHSVLHRVPVILEIDEATAPTPYMDYCLIAHSASLVEQCANYARTVDFIVHADRMLDKFARETDMAAGIGPLLDRLR